MMPSVPHRASASSVDKFTLLVIIGAFIFIFGFAYFFEHGKLQAKLEDALSLDRSVADLAGLLMKENQQASVNLIRSYATRSRFVDALEERNFKEITGHLADLQKNGKDNDRVFLTDEKGVVLANYPVSLDAIGKDLSSRDWYQGVSATWSPHVSSLFRRIIEPKPLAVAISVPVFDEEEKVIGTLNQSHVLSSIVDIFKPLRLDQDQLVHIVDQAGQVIFSNKDFSLEKITVYRLYPEVKRAVEERQTVLRLNESDALEGKEFLTIAPIDDLGWVVVVQRSMHALIRSQYESLAIAAAIAVLSFLLITVLFVYQSVLQRKTLHLLQLEKQRQAARDLLQNIASRVPGVVFEYVLRSDGSSSFPFVNEALADIYDIDPQEAREDATKVFARIHPDDREAVIASLQASARDLSPWMHDYRLKLDDGTVRWVSGSAIPGRRNDGSTVWHGVIMDTSALKLAEKALQKAQAQYLHAEKLSGVGKLSASIAHEVNSPLQTILTVLMTLRTAEALPEEDRRLLEMGVGEVRRVKDLVRNLQDIYRPSSMKKTFVDVHRSIDSLLLLLKVDFKLKAIEVKREYAEQLPPVFAVEDQIKQVFLNLLNNAAQACTPAGGLVTIKTGRRNAQVSVTFTDSGVGMSPEEIERLFKPFHTVRPGQKGLGLGLSISSEIVKNHGGDISLSSRPGQGTSITILLPVTVDEVIPLSNPLQKVANR